MGGVYNKEYSEHFDKHSKDDNIGHWEQDGFYYDSCYDDDKLVFRITDKNDNFKGYCNSFEMKCFHTVSSGIEEPYYKTTYPMKPFNNSLIDSTLIAFIASKNKGDREEATEMIVDKLKRRFVFYTTRNDENPEIWIYKKGIYVPEGRTHIHEFCRLILGKLYTTNLCNQVISKIEADTYINQDEFFNNENIDLIPVLNGVLNIKTKELLNFSPDFRFFNKINANYEPDKNDNFYHKFFSTIVREQDINLIQELFGFCLYKDYFLHKSFMFNGSGRNGKGVTLNILEKFVGKSNCTDLTLKDMEIDNFTLCRLHNKMVNISGDINNTKIRENAQFKKITGGDTLTAKRKFKTDLYFKNYAKMIFSCNEVPSFCDDTDANWLRWIFITFPYQFRTKKEIESLSIEEVEKGNIKEADPNIIDQVTKTENMTYLLNWALKGLDRLFENKEFSYDKSFKEVRQIMRIKSNNLIGFIDNNCECKYGLSINASDFREGYSLYCQLNKLKPLNTKQIIKTLEEEYGIFSKKTNGYPFYLGININNYKFKIQS